MKKTFFQWQKEISETTGLYILPKTQDPTLNDKELSEREFCELVAFNTVFYSVPAEFINEIYSLK